MLLHQTKHRTQAISRDERHVVLCCSYRKTWTAQDQKVIDKKLKKFCDATWDGVIISPVKTTLMQVQ